MLGFQGQRAEVNGSNCGVSAKKYADEGKGERREWLEGEIKYEPF